MISWAYCKTHHAGEVFPDGGHGFPYVGHGCSKGKTEFSEDTFGARWTSFYIRRKILNCPLKRILKLAVIPTTALQA